MADHSKIEWTEATQNPTVGCTHVSPGCDNCYAARLASGRLAHQPLYAGLAVNGRFTGEVRLVPERVEVALHWRKPRMIFVNSMSDLFHDEIPAEFIARVFAVMALARQHTFQILTKRHGRMRSLLSNADFGQQVAEEATEIIGHTPHGVWRMDMSGWTATPDGQRSNLWSPPWPLPNLWVGVSVENQKYADIRVPALLDTPAAVRFLSCEPLIGPVDLSRWQKIYGTTALDSDGYGGATITTRIPGLHWVIVGGESGPPAKDGPGIRPMHPDWARSLRDQCQAAGVPFHFKQWGDWAPTIFGAGGCRPTECFVGEPVDALGYRQIMRRVGKHAAGRELDGRTWDEFPTATEVRT